MRPQSRETIRSWDRRAIEEYGIPGIVLMENAARGCADLLLELSGREPDLVPPYTIICGPGNNGGDGFALARHLHNRSRDVVIHLVEPRSRVRCSSDAGTNLEIVERMGLDVREPNRDVSPADAVAAAPGVLIDAMLGTGLTRPLCSPYLEWVASLNSSGRPLVAIDIPTGLEADSGQVLGTAVRARHTLTMAAPKLGFETGSSWTGTVHVVEIGIPRELVERTDSN